MILLQFFVRRYGNPTDDTGEPTGCPVQGGDVCPKWGDGSLWGDGDLWCSNVGVPYEFIAEREVHGHRLAVRIDFTYCFTPGAPEAFRVHDVRGRIAMDRQAEYPYIAYIDGTTPSERLSIQVNYDSLAVIRDKTSNALHGSAVNTPLFDQVSAIQVGSSVHFEASGTPGYLQFAEDARYNALPISVEFWALQDVSSNEWATPISKTQDDQWDAGWGFYSRTSNSLFTWWCGAYDAHPSSTHKRFIRVSRPTLGAYHHYVGTYDGTTIQLYIDGVLVGTSTDTFDHTPASGNLYIGYGTFTESSWEGNVDEVAIFDHVLSQYEVTKHYETGRNEHAAAILGDSPIAYWPLDEEGATGHEFTVNDIYAAISTKKHQPKG